MTASQVLTTPVECLDQFFQRSEGQWNSDRRYYTLPNGATKTIQSLVTVRFLPFGAQELTHLAQLHHLDQPLVCGSWVQWESQNVETQQTESKGETIFGALGTTLFRDRGYATTKPVTAQFKFMDPQTLHLRTEYNKNVFEEELKFIGQRYRTRQTVISRAGEQLMVGQYLEKRI